MASEGQFVVSPDTPGSTGLPVNLLLDGQASYGLLDYDIKDNGASTTGAFDATRFSGTLSLTAVIVQSLGKQGDLRWLPKIGVSYSNEDQDGYTDSGNNVVSRVRKSRSANSRLAHRCSCAVTRRLEVFGRAEGQWDFRRHRHHHEPASPVAPISKATSVSF